MSMEETIAEVRPEKRPSPGAEPKNGNGRVLLRKFLSLFDSSTGEYYRPGLERLRLVLMFFMCIDLWGFPTAAGRLVQQLCGFAPIAFFILSGYLVLRESEHRSARIVRSIKRTAIVFAALLVVYSVISLTPYLLSGVNILPAFASKRLWFNFIVLNLWPFEVGSAIWYVQALLYAYIIIYFLDKWKLLKYDWLISVILILFTVVTGELCGLIPWNWHGYTYIPGGFLTRALPYVLLGGFLHRKMGRLLRVPKKWYIVMVFAGIILMILEIFLLGYLGVPGYYGHLIGMPVAAVAVCMLAFNNARFSGAEKHLNMSRWHINGIYYLCQPVGTYLVFLMARMGEDALLELFGCLGLFTFLLCFCIMWLVALIGRGMRRTGRKHGKKNYSRRNPDRDPHAV